MNKSLLTLNHTELCTNTELGEYANILTFKNLDTMIVERGLILGDTLIPLDCELLTTNPLVANILHSIPVNDFYDLMHLLKIMDFIFTLLFN